MRYAPNKDKTTANTVGFSPMFAKPWNALVKSIGFGFANGPPPPNIVRCRVSHIVFSSVVSSEGYIKNVSVLTNLFPDLGIKAWVQVIFTPRYNAFENLCSANIFLIKIRKRNTKKSCEICSELTIKTPERRQWRRSGVFIINFEHISQLLYCFYCWLWRGKCLLWKPSMRPT